MKDKIENEIHNLLVQNRDFKEWHGYSKEKCKKWNYTKWKVAIFSTVIFFLTLLSFKVVAEASIIFKLIGIFDLVGVAAVHTTFHILNGFISKLEIEMENYDDKIKTNKKIIEQKTEQLGLYMQQMEKGKQELQLTEEQKLPEYEIGNREKRIG